MTFQRWKPRSASRTLSLGEESTQFKVSGTSCYHCVKSVTRAMQNVSAMAAVSVDLKQGLVDVQGDLETAQIASAMKAAGFMVIRQVGKVALG